MNIQFIFRKLSPKKIYVFLEKAYALILVIIAVILLLLIIFFYYWFIYRAVRMDSYDGVTIEYIDSEHLYKILDEINHRKEALMETRQQQYNDPFN